MSTNTLICIRYVHIIYAGHKKYLVDMFIHEFLIFLRKKGYQENIHYTFLQCVLFAKLNKWVFWELKIFVRLFRPIALPHYCQKWGIEFLFASTCTTKIFPAHYTTSSVRSLYISPSTEHAIWHQSKSTDTHARKNSMFICKVSYA